MGSMHRACCLVVINWASNGHSSAPLAVLKQSAMKDIEEDVDEIVCREEEERMMTEAELEHIQCEAEIALNTRPHGDVLLPFFGDATQMMSEIPSEACVLDVSCDQHFNGRTDQGTQSSGSPFTVMTVALWRTLQRPMSEEVGTSTGETNAGPYSKSLSWKACT